MSDFPLATIPGTEVRMLRSQAAGQEYLISVALPFHYAEHPEKTYPVIYVPDANLFFGMVVEMVRMMNIRVPYCNELPNAIIVGIGYPTYGSLEESFAQVTHHRMRDFLPVADEGIEKSLQETFPIPNHIASGEAHRFLQFIHQELAPLIESEYRADASDRTLMGHSWGALFALYALFNQPHLFQRCVVVSPDLPYGNGVMLDYEQKYAEQHDSLAVRLYLAYGEPEVNDYQLPFLKPFMTALESRQYVGFTVAYQTIANCTHCAVVAPAFQAGLVAVFT